MLLLIGRTANPPGSQQYVFLIAEAIAKAEGFYAGDTLPKRRNNPGSITSGGSLIQFETEQAGWNALYNQIESMISGQSSYYDTGMSILDVAKVYTGGDKSDAWANIVASRLGVSIYDKFSELPQLLEA